MQLAYTFDPEILEAIRSVEQRLYAPAPLSGDERRDLANRLNALLAKAVAVDADSCRSFVA